MRIKINSVVAVFLVCGGLWSSMAEAQMFGARPGYANATLKQEHERQRLDGLRREAARQQAEREAADKAAKTNK